MPCRMDDMPSSAHLNSQRDVERLTKVADKLQSDLCKLGEFMADLLSDKTTIEDIRNNPDVIKLMAAHIKHRRKDRDRYIDAITKRMKVAKTSTTIEKLANELREVALMSDEDLLKTELF